jgi:hypothetical protein
MNDKSKIEGLDPQMYQILRNDLNNILEKFIEYIDLFPKNDLEKILSLICKELSKEEKNAGHTKI